MGLSVTRIIAVLCWTAVLVVSQDCPTTGCQQDGACPRGYRCIIEVPCKYGYCQTGTNKETREEAMVIDKVGMVLKQAVLHAL